jgi:Transposase DDE domain
VIGQDIGGTADGRFVIAQAVAPDRVISVADPTAPAGQFTKQQFRINLDQGTVTCRARLAVPIIPDRGRGGVARFGSACRVCPLQAACTSSAAGRTVTIDPHERRLQAARARQRDPAWRGPTTASTGPRWNANSRICCAASTGVFYPAG